MIFIIFPVLFFIFLIFVLSLILIKKIKYITIIRRSYEKYKYSKQNELSSFNDRNITINTLLDLEKQKNIELKQDHIFRIDELKQEIKEERAKSDLYVENIKDYKSKIAMLETKLKEQNNSMQDKIELLQNSETKLKIEFENVASKIFEDNSKKLTESNQENLNSVLNPVREQLKDFKQKVEDVYNKESIERGSLYNELKTLKDLNKKMTSEAYNLTNALRKNTKQQGIWGEMVLENVLENSGLREGYEYFREKYTLDDEGKAYRPDVIVKLPNNRDIIIDSKTSLFAYNDYMAADDDKKKYYLKLHIRSLRDHIKILTHKNYESLKSINSLDFVFMFIPIEGALLLALNNNINFYDEAYKQKIILVSPTSLLVALRAVENTWRYEKQSQSITNIYSRAEELYKKFVGFVDDLEKVGKSLNYANKSYENAFNKIKTGCGNLIGQVEKLKIISNIKPKKELDSNLVENAMEGEL